MDGPRYPHDCDRCVLVGRIGKYDIYDHNGDVIARSGPDDQYLSMSGYPEKVLGLAWRERALMHGSGE